MRALSAAERGNITEHPLLAAILQDLADVWADTGRLAEADQALSRATEINEALLGPSDPQVVELLRRRVDLLRRLGDMSEAASLEGRLNAIASSSRQ